jgi:hypothetical protein
MTKETYGAATQGAGWVSTQHVKAYMNPTAGYDFCSCMTFAQHELSNMLERDRIRM